MTSLELFLDNLQSQGKYTFTKHEGLSALNQSENTFTSSITRLVKKKRLYVPKQGFYVILRPEDRITGASDPIRWIDPLMKYLSLDYRISLLRAAVFHGSSHQASMVFQVIVPKQLRNIDAGHFRIQFIYQTPKVFAEVNREDWLMQMKSDTGYCKVSGVDLTLLDVTRYFQKSAGISGVAQIVHDLGMKANPKKLVQIATFYENTTVRRLGYLFDLFGYDHSAQALSSFVRKAKSFKVLNPSVKPLFKELEELHEQNLNWKLIINDLLEIDL
jgi:hypothetical protein